MYKHGKEAIARPDRADGGLACSCASDSVETPDLSDDSDCVEPDKQNPEGISRRSFLWDLAVGVAAGLTAGGVGEATGINDKARDAVEYLYDRFEQIGPNDSVEMTLGVVAIYGSAIDPDSCDGNGTDSRRRWGREHIESAVQDNVSQIEQTLGGQYQIDIKHIEKVVEPEGVRPRKDDSDEAPMYTTDQFK